MKSKGRLRITRLGVSYRAALSTKATLANHLAMDRTDRFEDPYAAARAEMIDDAVRDFQSEVIDRFQVGLPDGHSVGFADYLRWVGNNPSEDALFMTHNLVPGIIRWLGYDCHKAKQAADERAAANRLGWAPVSHVVRDPAGTARLIWISESTSTPFTQGQRRSIVPLIRSYGTAAEGIWCNGRDLIAVDGNGKDLTSVSLAALCGPSETERQDEAGRLEAFRWRLCRSKVFSILPAIDRLLSDPEFVAGIQGVGLEAQFMRAPRPALWCTGCGAPISQMPNDLCEDCWMAYGFGRQDCPAAQSRTAMLERLLRDLGAPAVSPEHVFVSAEAYGPRFSGFRLHLVGVIDPGAPVEYGLYWRRAIAMGGDLGRLQCVPLQVWVARVRHASSPTWFELWYHPGQQPEYIRHQRPGGAAFPRLRDLETGARRLLDRVFGLGWFDPRGGRAGRRRWTRDEFVQRITSARRRFTPRATGGIPVKDLASAARLGRTELLELADHYDIGLDSDVPI